MSKSLRAASAANKDYSQSSQGSVDQCEYYCGQSCGSLSKCNINYSSYGTVSSCECVSTGGGIFGGLFGTLAALAVLYLLWKWCSKSSSDEEPVRQQVQQVQQVQHVEQMQSVNVPTITSVQTFSPPTYGRVLPTDAAKSPQPSPPSSSTPFVSKVDLVRAQLGIPANLPMKEAIEQAESILEVPVAPNASLHARLESVLAALGIVA
ncbi:hypothetical protein T492DRAFT_1073566 [Pavlovales sp. CCMP2436]|nr:hypothetical protein T492DRAFT_1073566 [Pavlovales sp. CCMP2436]|mmetsp:Transcript_41861/g.97116  ORF Transcript_41861/g.97116 Transcript_41861/m.97116 type:complete len:207 (+) Transcript_41861:73-693(+)